MKSATVWFLGGSSQRKAIPKKGAFVIRDARRRRRMQQQKTMRLTILHTTRVEKYERHHSQAEKQTDRQTKQTSLFA